jgi:hypothetical protein
MVTSSHEAMHRIFQQDPGIFARTFTKLGFPLAEPATVSLLTTDVTEIRPLERRLDTLLRIDPASGGSYLLAVEAQGRKDPDKHGSWAYYASYLYAKYRLPPVLLVVCQDAATSRWAQGPIHIGIPEWHCLTVRPFVLGPDNVPAVTTTATAAEDIPLAAFSAITHSHHPQAGTMLTALAEALKKTDDETSAIFTEITELGLGNTPAATIWRDLMAIPTAFFRSETAEKLRDEGREKGREEGQVRNAVASLLRVLHARGFEVSDELLARIQECQDLDTLGRWLELTVTAKSVDEVFGEGGVQR